MTLWTKCQWSQVDAVRKVWDMNCHRIVTTKDSDSATPQSSRSNDGVTVNNFQSSLFSKIQPASKLMNSIFSCCLRHPDTRACAPHVLVAKIIQIGRKKRVCEITLSVSAVYTGWLIWDFTWVSQSDRNHSPSAVVQASAYSLAANTLGKCPQKCSSRREFFKLS